MSLPSAHRQVLADLLLEYIGHRYYHLHRALRVCEQGKEGIQRSNRLGEGKSSRHVSKVHAFAFAQMAKEILKMTVSVGAFLTASSVGGADENETSSDNSVHHPARTRERVS